jgi:hypothetical protein
VSATPPSDLAGFEFEDILRVEVDALGVQVAPLTHMPLATGWQDGITDIGEVRLNTGDYVSVELGPLRIGDTTWYRVLPAENAELHASTVWWDTKFDGPDDVEPGWIAAAIGDDAFVTLQQSTEPESFLDGLPLLASGAGDYESGPIEGSDLYVIEWAYVADDGQPAQCGFTVSMAAGDSAAEVVILDLGRTGVGAYHDGAAEIGAGNRTPVVGDDFSPLLLRISSGCSWTVRLQGVPHD